MRTRDRSTEADESVFASSEAQLVRVRILRSAVKSGSAQVTSNELGFLDSWCCINSFYSVPEISCT